MYQTIKSSSQWVRLRFSYKQKLFTAGNSKELSTGDTI